MIFLLLIYSVYLKILNNANLGSYKADGGWQVPISLSLLVDSSPHLLISSCGGKPPVGAQWPSLDGRLMWWSMDSGAEATVPFGSGRATTAMREVGWPEGGVEAVVARSLGPTGLWSGDGNNLQGGLLCCRSSKNILWCCRLMLLHDNAIVGQALADMVVIFSPPHQPMAE